MRYAWSSSRWRSGASGSIEIFEQREAAAEAARLLDLVAHHVVQVLDPIGAGVRVLERAPLEPLEALGVAVGGVREREELLGARAVDLVEALAAELVGEPEQARERAAAAQRDHERGARQAVGLAPVDERGGGAARAQRLRAARSR